MNFDFIKNEFLGEYHAKFDLEHQVIGRWLVDEIATDRTKIEQVFALLEQATNNPMQEYQLMGREISLSLLQGEVTIEENALTQCIDSELDEDFSLYTTEGYSCCGLDDFALMFSKWCEFIQGN